MSSFIVFILALNILCVVIQKIWWYTSNQKLNWKSSEKTSSFKHIDYVAEQSTGDNFNNPQGWAKW